MELKIPRSVKNETFLKFEKSGHIGESENILNGDLFVKILIEESKIYKIKENDLHITKSLSLNEVCSELINLTS